MKVETKTKLVAICSVCLACLILCGCYEEQSNHKRTKKIDAKYKQEEIDGYAQVVYDALDYVHEHSTERMKRYIARGKLVIGMNQEEVIACLHTINFRYCVPVTSNTINSKYGKYETLFIGSSSGSKDSSYSPPRYTLDFTYYILASIRESKVFQVDGNFHLARAD